MNNNRLWMTLTVVAAICTQPACKRQQSTTKDGTKGEKPTQPVTKAGIFDSKKARGAGIETPPEYGPVDAEGFPMNPGFAMNSDKILDEQKSELRSNPPEQYQVETLVNPRFINRKDDRIKWRQVDASGNLASFLEAIGLPGRVPEGLFPDDEVIFSPSANRMVVVAHSLDRAKVFEKDSEVWNMSQGVRVRSVTFDDKWRWYISWQAFMTESVVVGISITDDDIEKYPELRLYTYHIDNQKLTRVRLPSAIQPEGVHVLYQIEAVSANSLLLRLGYREGQKDDLFTVYLDGSEPNASGSAPGSASGSVPNNRH